MSAHGTSQHAVTFVPCRNALEMPVHRGVHACRVVLCIRKPARTPMKRKGEDPFELRPRPARSRGDSRSASFLQRVQREMGRAGSGLGVGTRQGSRPGVRTGRGNAVVRLYGGAAGARARRVVVKSRVVRLKATGTAAVAAHLRYIAREGIERDGATPSTPYDAVSNTVDINGFQARGAKDRHHFRFIIAPEDAVELSDLRAFTRGLMDRVARDLATPLDWVAVDHWDTDNPHTHVVLRGRDGSGKDLVIAGDYIAAGIRMRASELATSWLGPRTDAEIHASLDREVEAERWTSLDREIKACLHEGRLPVDPAGDLREGAGARARLVGRLAYLESLGLAESDTAGGWTLRPDSEDVLRSLGERGDIIRTMQRAFGRSHREMAIFDPSVAAPPVVGRVTDKGFSNTGFGDHGYLIVDGLDGRGHYVRLPASADLKALPIGGIVEVGSTPARSSDRNIAAAAVNGLYVARNHLAQLRASLDHRAEATEIAGSHVRRLEALRRAGIVERVTDGLWRVPVDLVARGREYDIRRHGSTDVRLLCHLPIERQVREVGATWLDRQLVDDKPIIGTSGFAISVRNALKIRADFLVDKGFVPRTASLPVYTSSLLETLRQRELNAAGRTMATKLGLPYRPARAGTRVSGVYRESIQLVSARFAVLSDGLGFSLVPWKPVLEDRMGRGVTASVQGDRIAFRFGRDRGHAIS